MGVLFTNRTLLQVHLIVNALETTTANDTYKKSNYVFYMRPK